MISRIIIIVFMLITIPLLGCQTPRDISVTETIPQWLKGDPRIEGMICAIGISEPTFYRKEALRYAADNARQELARTLSVEINSLMIDFNSEGGSSVNEGTAIEVTSWATETVLENSEIIEYWYDSEGSVSRKNSTFALDCIPKEYVRSKQQF